MPQSISSHPQTQQGWEKTEIIQPIMCPRDAQRGFKVAVYS